MDVRPRLAEITLPVSAGSMGPRPVRPTEQFGKCLAKKPLPKYEKWLCRLEILEATPGFEPGMADLQSAALATWPRRHDFKKVSELTLTVKWSRRTAQVRERLPSLASPQPNNRHNSRFGLIVPKTLAQVGVFSPHSPFGST